MRVGRGGAVQSWLTSNQEIVIDLKNGGLSFWHEAFRSITRQTTFTQYILVANSELIGGLGERE